MRNKILFLAVLTFFIMGCQGDYTATENDSTNVVESKLDLIEINSIEDLDLLLESLTLEEKAGQIIQRTGGGSDASANQIAQYNIGSILAGGGGSPTENTPEGWVERYNRIQNAMLETSTSGIPMIYGIDAVHGHNNVANAVIFPHNIGLGAGNNPDLMEKIGGAVAKEIKATGIDWNFAPAVSVVQNIRWGRTYESFGETSTLATDLGSRYIIGLQNEGIIATTKHFVGDGQTENGVDQGNVTVTEEELLELNLPAYKAAIAAGTKTIMASFNSFQGDKLHGSKKFLTDLLRTELGFTGLVVSDWEAIAQLEGSTTLEKVEKAVNAGVDLLMQPESWEVVYGAVIKNVESGAITEERLNEAVKRNLV